MPRLIDADALIAEMHNIILEDGEDRRVFYEVIERQPTIEPERQMGKWIKMSDADGIFYACSECGEWHKEISNYCPNCGARMEMRGDNNG